MFYFSAIDECATNYHSCDVNAVCRNIVGSYNCTCKVGFYGNGRKCFGKLQHRYGLLTKREVKMAGYWPSSFFACLCPETKSRSINTQKKNEANILPS